MPVTLPLRTLHNSLSLPRLTVLILNLAAETLGLGRTAFDLEVLVVLRLSTLDETFPLLDLPPTFLVFLEPVFLIFRQTVTQQRRAVEGMIFDFFLVWKMDYVFLNWAIYL